MTFAVGNSISMSLPGILRCWFLKIKKSLTIKCFRCVVFKTSVIKFSYIIILRKFDCALLAFGSGLLILDLSENLKENKKLATSCVETCFGCVLLLDDV